MNKILIILTLFFASSLTFGSEPKLILDASCKVSCSQQEDFHSPGYPTREKITVIYQDIMGKTRQEIEAYAANTCQRKLSGQVYSKKVDCEFFKR